MTDQNRRSILSGLLVAGGGLLGSPVWAALDRTRNIQENPSFLIPPFQLGVASGDPAPDGFVIWTRLAPEPLQPGGGMVMIPVLVKWEVSADPDFRSIAGAGEAIAHPELAHAVHVEVAGLQPDRPYWYRFQCGRDVEHLVGDA